MPVHVSPYVKKLATETGKTTREVEALWSKAKAITAENFGKTEEEFTKKEFQYAYETVRNMLGMDESVLDPSDFLGSEMSAKEFIETLTSGSFDISNVNPPEDEEEEEDKDEEEDEPNVIDPAERESPKESVKKDPSLEIEEEVTDNVSPEDFTPEPKSEEEIIDLFDRLIPDSL